MSGPARFSARKFGMFDFRIIRTYKLIMEKHLLISHAHLSLVVINSSIWCLSDTISFLFGWNFRLSFPYDIFDIFFCIFGIFNGIFGIIPQIILTLLI